MLILSFMHHISDLQILPVVFRNLQLTLLKVYFTDSETILIICTVCLYSLNLLCVNSLGACACPRWHLVKYFSGPQPWDARIIISAELECGSGCQSQNPHHSYACHLVCPSGFLVFGMIHLSLASGLASQWLST